jgi:hypothetical protein
MDEIRLPQHVVNRFERQWTARFTQMLEGWQRADHARFSPASPCDDPLRSPRVWRLLDGSLRPPTFQ